MEVVHEKWSARTHAQRVLIVADWAALRRGQDVVPVLGILVKLTPCTAVELLVMNGDGVAARF
jgi:hypothetical protein